MINKKKDENILKHKEDFDLYIADLVSLGLADTSVIKEVSKKDTGIKLTERGDKVRAFISAFRDYIILEKNYPNKKADENEAMNILWTFYTQAGKFTRKFFEEGSNFAQYYVKHKKELGL